MTAFNPNLITLSHATFVGASGATAAATYRFFTKDYKPPSEARAIEKDIVVNQNGKFKYVYDNGPGFKQWSPFSVACENAFASVVGATAGLQYARLRQMWNYKGALGMTTPDGTYVIAWSDSMERNFRVFPRNAGDIIEYEVIVQFEEAQ